MIFVMSHAAPRASPVIVRDACPAAHQASHPGKCSQLTGLLLACYLTKFLSTCILAMAAP